MITKTTWRDHVVGALIAAVYMVVLCATAADLGMSRDESFYVEAGERYGAWFETLFDGSGSAFERGAIDRAWSYNSEHPPLMKSLFAFSWIAHKKWQLFSSDTLAFRFPAIAISGLFLWLIYIFGTQARSRAVGIFAAFAFALLPRPFYHAHLNAFDMPIAFFVTFVMYAYWRSLTSRAWIFGAGLVYGLALATKHNAWIVPGVCLIHFTFVVFRERTARREDSIRRIPYVPYGLLSMLVIGPVVFVASWPWLWHDTLERFTAYAQFHLHHDYYNMAYFGRNYFWPPFPISYSWVMTLFTVPLVTLALACFGFVLSIFQGALSPRAIGDRTASSLLWIGALFAPYAAMSLPSTPIFGGTKHWFTAYPFMALFAGVAFEFVARTLSELAKKPLKWIAVPAAALLLVPAMIETAHAHPFGLSYYTPAAGGVPGAATHGMNRQFWGFTTRSLADFFKERLPNGGSVWICDTTVKAWEMLQRDGIIPANLRATGNFAGADLILVHHELHFAEVDFQAWVAFGSVKPAHVLTYDGVPIISVYENPRRARR